MLQDCKCEDTRRLAFTISRRMRHGKMENEMVKDWPEGTLTRLLIAMTVAEQNQSDQSTYDRIYKQRR